MLKEKLKQARRNASLTQKEVAEIMGISQQQYARWEQGQRNPKHETLEKLAEIFGITVDALKGRDDGLEDIIDTLRRYNPTEEEKAHIRSYIDFYLKARR
ncbi:helix-turn-helix transcriptional regulator [Streptococcus suis]